MYVVKNLTTGQTMPNGNQPCDNADWATALPGWRVALTHDYATIVAWLNGTVAVEVTAAHPDPLDANVTIPAVFAEHYAANTIDLEANGNILLKHADGTTIQTLVAAEVIQ